MKTSFTLLLCAILAFTLSGCGNAPAIEPDSSTSLSDSEKSAISTPIEDIGARTEDIDAGFTLTAEWSSYDPTVEQIWFTVRNTGEETLETGEDYQLEYSRDGTWETIPLKEDSGWNSLLVCVQPDSAIAFRCLLSQYEFNFPTGNYRFAKTIHGQTVYGNFTLETGTDISGAAPYGFAPLEELPKEYDRDTAVSDGCVVFPNIGEPQNLDAMHTFLAKVQLGIPCQVRIMHFTDEGVPLIEDVIYDTANGAGRFSYRWDDSRDGFDADPHIGDTFYFSFLNVGQTAHTVSYYNDGNEVHREESSSVPTIRLSYEAESGEGFDLLSGEEAEPFVETVQAMTVQALESSTIRRLVWDQTGTRYAVLTTEPLAFGWGESGFGTTSTLADYDGLDKEILLIYWADAHTLELVVEQTIDTQGAPVVYHWDTETERLTTTDITYTTRSYISPRDR